MLKVKGQGQYPPGWKAGFKEQPPSGLSFQNLHFLEWLFEIPWNMSWLEHISLTLAFLFYIEQMGQGWLLIEEMKEFLGRGELKWKLSKDDTHKDGRWKLTDIFHRGPNMANHSREEQSWSGGGIWPQRKMMLWSNFWKQLCLFIFIIYYLRQGLVYNLGSSSPVFPPGVPGIIGVCHHTKLKVFIVVLFCFLTVMVLKLNVHSEFMNLQQILIDQVIVLFVFKSLNPWAQWDTLM